MEKSELEKRVDFLQKQVDFLQKQINTNKSSSITSEQLSEFLTSYGLKKRDTGRVILMDKTRFIVGVQS